MRPALCGTLSVGTTSPSSASGLILRASASVISVWGDSTTSTTVLMMNTLTSPVPGSSVTLTSCPAVTLSFL